jgi:hypothetical protein
MVGMNRIFVATGALAIELKFLVTAGGGVGEGGRSVITRS